MCASVFQHIFTALALQLHCSSDKDNKYMLDIFSLQFVRLQLEMKSNIQSFSPFAYNLSSQTFTYQYIHPSWFFERTFTHHRPQLNKRHLPIGTFTHHRPQLTPSRFSPFFPQPANIFCLTLHWWILVFGSQSSPKLHFEVPSHCMFNDLIWFCRVSLTQACCFALLRVTKEKRFLVN